MVFGAQEEGVWGKLGMSQISEDIFYIMVIYHEAPTKSENFVKAPTKSEPWCYTKYSRILTFQECSCVCDHSLWVGVELVVISLPRDFKAFAMSQVWYGEETFPRRDRQ